MIRLLWEILRTEAFIARQRFDNWRLRRRIRSLKRELGID